jgi:hypothetical protein
MYENGKMRPAETIPGIRGRGIKKNSGGANSTVLFYRHLSKYRNVPQYNNNMINKNVKIEKRQNKRDKELAGKDLSYISRQGARNDFYQYQFRKDY